MHMYMSHTLCYHVHVKYIRMYMYIVYMYVV